MPKKKKPRPKFKNFRARLRWAICCLLTRVARRLWITPPDVEEIVHYAVCPSCRRKIKAQGWRVEFQNTREGVYEVTFRHSLYVKHLQEYLKREKEAGMYA